MRFSPEVSPRRSLRPALVAHGSPTAADHLRTLVANSDLWPDACVAQKLTQALALTEVVMPELILMDLDLAGENFAHVITWMKKKNPSSTLVIVSQACSAGLRQACVDAGADHFFDENNPNALPEFLEELWPNRSRMDRHSL